jgi:apolipoprotein N-acyltransferase
MARYLNAPLILGVEAVAFDDAGQPLRYNAALQVSREGELVGRYDKIHLVMFGEYIPLGKTFPWLYRFSPMGGGLEAGDAPQSFTTDGARLAPNICYETVIPHVIAGQVRALRARGEEPDALVNLTNDAWFWGSSELDMHLVCGVFRAVECRKPFLIAANTGFSARIDADGRILARGPRRAADVLLAEVGHDHRGSWYLRHGDLPAGLCLAACVALAAIGLTPILARACRNW